MKHVQFSQSENDVLYIDVDCSGFLHGRPIKRQQKNLGMPGRFLDAAAGPAMCRVVSSFLKNTKILKAVGGPGTV